MTDSKSSLVLVEDKAPFFFFFLSLQAQQGALFSSHRTDHLITHLILYFGFPLVCKTAFIEPGSWISKNLEKPLQSVSRDEIVRGFSKKYDIIDTVAFEKTHCGSVFLVCRLYEKNYQKIKQLFKFLGVLMF